MELGNFDCGCENRKEIIGSGTWMYSGVAVGVVIAVIALVVYAKR